MTSRAWVPVLLLVAMAALCVRLGFWQLSRLAEKRRGNAALREAMIRPPVEHGPLPGPLDRVRNRRVRLSGHYDETRQVLVPGHAPGDMPGVRVITPLTLDVWGAVLVDRGWITTGDPASVRLEEWHEPGEVTVIGLAESLATRTRGATWRTLESDSVYVWSTAWLALDSLKSRLPYVLAPYLVRQLPAPGVPTRPLRAVPAPLDENVHLSYSIQWFLIALILLSGAFVLQRASRRGAGPPRAPSGGG